VWPISLFAQFTRQLAHPHQSKQKQETIEKRHRLIISLSFVTFYIWPPGIIEPRSTHQSYVAGSPVA
jgi:hypothetical protein